MHCLKELIWVVSMGGEQSEHVLWKSALAEVALSFECKTNLMAQLVLMQQ